jgi:hypothetical protein
MKTLVASSSVDLWPKAYPVTSYCPTGGRLTLEVPGLSEGPLLAAVAHIVHLEMRAAGEWAARMGEPGDHGLFGPSSFHRLRKDNAARLLAIYTALYGCASYLSDLDLSPEALKSSASRCYTTALRGSRPSSQGASLLSPASTKP